MLTSCAQYSHGSETPRVCKCSKPTIHGVSNAVGITLLNDYILYYEKLHPVRIDVRSTCLYHEPFLAPARSATAFGNPGTNHSQFPRLLLVICPNSLNVWLSQKGDSFQQASIDLGSKTKCILVTCKMFLCNPCKNLAVLHHPSITFGLY